MNKNNKKIILDGSCHDYLMRNNGFAVGFNMPAALSGENTFGLPPYAKRMPYLVDKYPACPENWMRSEGKIKSYFVPVVEGNGMWLDLNENTCHTHHVAVVISVQGVNPITGMPCKDAQLEQYLEECPKHKVKFGPDRYCKKCDYKWPKQNYITTTSTPYGDFWIDGFRSIDGIVRQYILTEEKMKGVASNIVGKDRVYAIGLSFFISKEKKPLRNSATFTRGFYSPVHTPIDWTKSAFTSKTYTNTNIDTSRDIDQYRVFDGKANDELCYFSDPKSKSIEKSEIQIPGGSYDGWQNRCSDSLIHSTPVKITKNLEVGAGAKINQKIYDDPEKLDYWHDESESIICINYVTEDVAKKIIEGGEISLEGHKEGFLKNIPVGN